MGYESSLHLIDIKIKAESVPLVKRILESRKGRGVPPCGSFSNGLCPAAHQNTFGELNVSHPLRVM
jgi:hypothetical protein